MISNGFHPSHHPHQLHQTHMQQAIYATTSDPTTAALLQVSAVSPGAAAATANGLLPPQQRTDRLQVLEFNNYKKTFVSLFKLLRLFIFHELLL